mgnify:CR=1 FL=1
MATIKLQGNASGSGSVTLTAPNTNSARTITLPDQDVDFGNLGGAGSIVAWVNFNSIGTVSIRNNGNVSSITDIALGRYNVNFSTSLTSADYSMSYLNNSYSTNNSTVNSTLEGFSGATAVSLMTTSQVRVNQSTGNTNYDSTRNLVSIVL